MREAHIALLFLKIASIIKINFFQEYTFCEPSMEYLYLHNLPSSFGAPRRALIAKWFESHAKTGVMAINRKWQAQLKLDPDLQKLLKKGALVRYRSRNYQSTHKMGWKKGGCNQTYLVSPLFEGLHAKSIPPSQKID